MRIPGWTEARQFAIVVALSFPIGLKGDNGLSTQPIRLMVDATEIDRQLVHAQLIIPVSPGPLTLAYPKWIPGEHGPTGPIDGLVDLKLTVNGQPLAWRRDLVELYLIHCEIPTGASEINISLDYIIPTDTENRTSTPLLGIIAWNQVLLYPSGINTDDISIQGNLRIPEGWQFGTALPMAEHGSIIRFQPVSLTTLVDSPLVTGKYYRNVKLVETVPTSELDIVADSAGALALPDEKIEQYRRLIAEAAELFGATHYLHYHFLAALSENIFHDGLEHHESSLNTMQEDRFTDKDSLAMESDLLPHEFVHSWNGKYRRPAVPRCSGFSKADARRYALGL
jgi:predicted metalloprotease with PDZ domain